MARNWGLELSIMNATPQHKRKRRQIWRDVWGMTMLLILLGSLGLLAYGMWG